MTGKRDRSDGLNGRLGKNLKGKKSVRGRKALQRVLVGLVLVGGGLGALALLLSPI